jgi:predicted Zn finger-like uncharacterized protein
VKFLCEQCKAKYQIADDKVAGKTVRMKCRKCGHLIEVRAAVTETSVSVQPREPERPSAPPPAPRSAHRPPPPRPAPIASSFAASKAASKPERPLSITGALEGAFKAAVQRDDETSAPFDMSDLSPSDEWYVAINGVPVGPIRVAEVRRKAALGAVNEDSLVWQEGLDEWRPMRSFPELAASVREAISSARASRPPSTELRSSLPPPPPGRSSPSRVPTGGGLSRSAPPRVAAAALPASHAPRSNVVPFMSRLATAEKLDEMVAARASPVPGSPPPPPAAPVPSVVPDPFAVIGPLTSAPPAAAPVPVAAAPASVRPAAAKAPPWMALAMIAAAVAFGATTALTLFLRPAAPPTPAAPVATPQAPAPQATATAPAAAAVPVPTNAVAEPAEPVATVAVPKPRVVNAPRAAPTGEASPPSGGRSLDLHALTQSAPSVAPGEDPAADSPKAAAATCVSSGQLMQVIGLHQPALKRTCWERNPTNKMSVNVSVNMTIMPDGSIQNVSATGDEPSVAKCIENDVRGWRFPPMGCSQPANIPFHFVKQ